jgi:Multiubiquitin
MANEARFVIVLNGKEFSVSEPVVEGLQVRVLGGLDPQHELILECMGDEPDRVIRDTDQIDLRQGPVRLFAKPPTSFG